MARRDIHAEITETILEQLRQGIRPWMKPWGAGAGAVECAGMPLRVTGAPYGGINVLVLWSAAAAKGYQAPTWMTFRQAVDHGGMVRKGERGEKVVFASRFTKKELDPNTGVAKETEIAFHKTYTVFNVGQIDGLDERWYRTHAEIGTINPDRRIEKVERYFRALDIDLRHGGDDAYYVLRDDYIQMPPFGLFHDAEGYYSTLAHESVHWTRHESRLDRRFRSKSAQDSYAKEELVAEIGSAFLAAELGFTPCVREDHANYIGAWLRVLGSDPRAIFTAASQASKAVNWIHKHAQVETLGIDATIGETAMVVPAVVVVDSAESGPVRGVAPGAVQGELFRDGPTDDAYLVAAKEGSIREAKVLGFDLEPPTDEDIQYAVEVYGHYLNAELIAAQVARRVVSDVEAFRTRAPVGGNDASWRRQAAVLLADVDRIDLATPGVRGAIEAAVAVSGAGRGRAVDAVAYLDTFKTETRRWLNAGSESELHRHRVGGGVSM